MSEARAVAFWSSALQVRRVLSMQPRFLILFRCHLKEPGSVSSVVRNGDSWDARHGSRSSHLPTTLAHQLEIDPIVSPDRNSDAVPDVLSCLGTRTSKDGSRWHRMLQIWHSGMKAIDHSCLQLKTTKKDQGVLYEFFLYLSLSVIRKSKIQNRPLRSRHVSLLHVLFWVYVVYPMFKTHPQRWPKKPSPEHDVTASERTSLTWVRFRAQICKLNLSWWNCVYRITNISHYILQNHFEGLGICEFFIWPAAVIRKNSSLFCSALQTVVSRGRCSSQTQAWAASLWHLGRRAYSQYGHMMFDGNRLDTHTWEVWSDPLRLQMFAK